MTPKDIFSDFKVQLCSLSVTMFCIFSIYFLSSSDVAQSDSRYSLDTHAHTLAILMKMSHVLDLIE